LDAVKVELDAVKVELDAVKVELAALKANRPALEQAILNANLQVQAAEAKVASEERLLLELTGMRAAEYLQRALRKPVYHNEPPAGIILADSTATPPPAKMLKRATISLVRRIISHSMPHSVVDWDDFESAKTEWLANKVGDRFVVSRNDDLPTDLRFIEEKDFISYWLLPRTSTHNVLCELFPESRLKETTIISSKDGVLGRTDEALVLYLKDGTKRALEVTEHKHPSVRFYTTNTVAKLVQKEPPPEMQAGRGMKGNVLKSLVQTYTYMISDAKNMQRYGAFSNWNQWVFMKREVVDGKERLHVSRWYDRTQARLAWAYFVYLAALDADVSAHTW